MTHATGRHATRRALLAAGAAAAALPFAAHAQSIAGGRTLRIVVPYGAGGAVDVVARLVAQEIAPRLGQTVVVDNRTGGGGNIAMEHVARAAPDGTTLLMASPAVVANAFLYPSLSYDAATQLAPVALVGESPTVLLTSPGFEAPDARRFLEMARARPGHYTFGSGGGGTTEHLAGEMLKARTGLDLLHVPYRGGAPAMTDLAAGRISVMFTNLAQSLPLIRGGQLRPLAITDQRRSPALPEVPTFAELGIPDFNVKVWWGVMGPAGMPADAVQRLNAVINEALAGGLRPAIERMSATPLGGSAEDFGRFLEGERSAWGAVIRGANIRME